MTATETPTIQAESSPPPAAPPAARRRRRVLLGAGLAVLAAIALIAWLLTMSSETQTRPVAPASAAVPPQQADPAGQASAGSNAGAVESSGAYVQFCQNSPVLCSPAAPPVPNAGYVQFCLNSPALCTVAKPN
jgi:hypothetical protein